MSDSERIVSILIKWITTGEGVAKHTGDKLKQLDTIAGELSSRLRMTRAELLNAFVDAATDGEAKVNALARSTAGFTDQTGVTNDELNKYHVVLNSLADTFADSEVSVGELKKMFTELAKELETSGPAIGRQIMDYTGILINEHVKMARSVSKAKLSQDELREATKKMFMATRKVDTTEAWQDQAQAMFGAVQAQREVELGLKKVAKEIVKGKGSINAETAALYSSVSARLKVLDLSKEMTKAVEREIKLQEEEGDALDKGDKKKKKVGMRYSWLGYRLFSMGRILQKWLLKPLQDGIKIMANWESSIENAAVTMALAEYYGIELGNTIEDTAQYFREFAEEGQRTQVALGSLRLLMGDMAKDMGLSTTIQNIAGALRELWDGIKDTIGAEGFKGLIAVGVLATGAMIAFGSAMFFLAPIAAAIGVSVGMLMGALLAIGFVVTAALVHWKDLKDVWGKTVGPALTRLNEAFKKFGDVLGVQIELWDVFKLITLPIAATFKMIMKSVERAINVFTIFVNLLTAAAEGIKGIGKWANNVFGHSIGKDIARDLTPAIKSMKDLNAQMGGIGGGAGGRGGMSGPQYISIYPEISLAGATISSEVDLMQISDATERGISEALRRRAYPRWGRR